MAIDPLLVQDIGDATNARLKQFKGFYAAFNDAIRGKCIAEEIIPELRIAVGKYLNKYKQKHKKDKRAACDMKFKVLSTKNGVMKIMELESKAIFDFAADHVQPPSFRSWSKLAHPTKEMLLSVNDFARKNWLELAEHLHLLRSDQTSITFVVDDRVELWFQHKDGKTELYRVAPRPGNPAHGEVDGKVAQRAHHLAEQYFLRLAK